MPNQFSDFYNSLDPDSAKRGKQFEHFVKWFLKADPEWSTQVDQVWLWDEWPERWGADCGIDLVFRDKNGENWAVQAKCYSPDYDITKHDVDKFLSESNRPSIKHRLLIATTDRIGGNAKQVCDAQEKPVVRFLLSDFELSVLDYPANLGELSQAKRKARPEARAHQRDAIAAVAQGLHTADRGQLIMACGTGKTYVTLWIKEQLDAQRSLVLVPSLGLLSQLLREWTFAALTPFEVLCVCSDQTVGTKGNDEAIHSVADLAFPVTSDADEVRRFLRGSGNRVVFSTYQSSSVIVAAQSDPTIPAFDLLVADEAHRCAGKVGSDFTTILDNAQIRSAKRLFATATPRTYSSNVKKAAEDRGVEVVGMDKAVLFGEVLYALPFGKAIECKLLTDYRVVIIGVDDPTIAQWIANRELVSTDTGIETDTESLAAQIGLLKAIKDYDLKRVISFHSRVNRAERFTADIQNVMAWISDEHRPSGTLRTDFVAGNMPANKRKIKLDQLKGLAADERGVLSNARCLSEGVDVPSLDGVAFIDPRSSQVDIIQAVGRAIRLSPDKKTGTIVLPVFIAAGQDADATIAASNFKPIWDVLNALKAHDDVLAYELDQIRTELGRKPGTGISADGLRKITIDLPATVDSNFGNALRTHLVEQVTAPWMYCYGVLQAHAEMYGKARVLQTYETTDGLRLGTWIATQRSNKAADLLSRDRIELLEALPGWSWDLIADRWEEDFEQLQSYVHLYGNARVPATYSTPNGVSLGDWAQRQRKCNAKKLLSHDRVERLEALPGWSWDPLVEQWDDAFEQYLLYVQLHGSTKINCDYETSDGLRLGAWIQTQRTRKTRNLLSQDRISRFEAISGWSWDPFVDQWEDAFEQLQSYVQLHGDTRAPTNYSTPDGLRLGFWVSTQRSNNRKGLLSQDRIERLEALPGWSWNFTADRWEETFEQLRSYTEINGDARVPKRHVLPDGLNLGIWAQNQRNNKNKNLLTDEQAMRLESLTGWSWDILAEQWEEAFRQIQSYVLLHGNARVPTSYSTPDGLRLGLWTRTQRKYKAENLLPQDRFERLKALPGWSWDPVADQWEDAFKQMQLYAHLHGDARIPKSYSTSEGLRLGAWAGTQRSNKATNILSQDRLERLEALPGWSW